MAERGMTKDVLLKIISQFDSKGADQAKKSLLDLGKLDKTSFLGGLGNVFKGMVGSITGLLNPLKAVNGMLGVVGAGAKQLGGIFKIALGVVAGTAINTAVGALRQLVTAPVEVAARVGALEVVFYRIGQQAGYAKDKLSGFVEGLKETGITTRQSLENLTKMIQANLDLSRATDLARVAQNAAVIAGVNSSEAFSRLLHGITTLQPEVLRGLGIVVDMQAEVKKWAAANDVAAESISATTKQQIAFDAVLAAGQRIAGSYESAMTEVGKKLTSLPRYIEEAQLALGKGLKPVLSSVVDILGDVLKKAKTFFETIQPAVTAFSERVGAGLASLYEKAQGAVGALIEGFSRVQPYLQQVGEILGHYLPQMASRLKLLWIELKNALSGLASAASAYLPQMAGAWTLFTDTVKAALESVLKILDGFRLLLKGQGEQAAKNFSDAIANGLAVLIIVWEDYVSQALTWGYNLVSEFAQGMISAASQWITAAVEYVGNLIAGFFASFSPPKKGILRGILDWGRGLINEYFKGFTQADFSILDQVGGAIKNALQSAVALGDLPEQELIPMFRKIRTLAAGLISDFRKTGEISEEALSKIGETLGEGSEDLVQYLRLQLEHQKALKELGDVAEEYAEAEAKGFIPAELKDRLKAAQARAEETKEELSWQEALIRAQQDSVDLQVQQVRVLQKLAKVLDKMAAATKRAPKAKKAEAAAAPTMPALTMPALDASKLKEDIDAGIRTAFEGVSERFGEAKEKAKGLMGNLVEGAREALADLPGTIREGIGLAFETLREKLPWIDEIIAKFDQFKTWWTTHWPAMLATAQSVWNSIKATVGAAIDIIVGTSWPKLQAAFASLTDVLAEFGISWDYIWLAAKFLLKTVLTTIGLLLAQFVGVIVGIINGIATALQWGGAAWKLFMLSTKSAVEAIGRLITGLVMIVQSLLSKDFAGALEGGKQVLRGFAELVGSLVAMAISFFATGFATIAGLIGGFVEGVIEFFKSLKDRLVGGSIIPEMVDEALAVFTRFRDRATELMAQARDWIEEKIGGIADSFNRIRDAIGEAIGKLGEFLGSLAQAVIPDWLLPGSATPFEQGLWGILGVLNQLGTAAQSLFVFQKMRTDLQALVGEGGLIPFFVTTTIVRFTELGVQVSRLVTQMKDQVVRLLTEMVNTGIQLITTFRTRAIALFTEIKNRVVQLVTQMVQRVLDALRELRDESEPILVEIAQIFEKMGDRIAEAIKKIKSEIKKLIGKLEDLKKAAEDAAAAMKDAGIMGESPSLLELSFAGASRELSYLRQEMGLLGRGLNISPATMRPATAPVGGGGTTFQLFIERFEFPSVRSGRDAGDIWTEIQAKSEKATALAQVPGGTK